MAQPGLAHRALVGARDIGAIQAVLRRRAVRRLGRLEAGAVTVVIASWNSEQFLGVCLAAVRRFADRPTKILVVDNHSNRSPRDLVLDAGARCLRLPFNAGHSMALDIGFLTSRTEYSVALDVDAFPFGDDWLPTMLAPLQGGSTVVGPTWNNYAHPCSLAMRTAHFVRSGYSFASDPKRGWDVGEAISRQEGPARVTLLPKLGNLRGDEVVGATYRGSIYHNSYGTRHLRLRAPEAEILDGAITRKDALAVWDEAMQRYGPNTWS